MAQRWVFMLLALITCCTISSYASVTDTILNMGDFSFEAVSRSNCPNSKFLGIHACSTAPTATLVKTPFPWALALNNTSRLSNIQATCPNKTKSKSTTLTFQHPKLSGSRSCNLVKPTFTPDTTANNLSPYLWSIVKVKGTEDTYTIQLTDRSRGCLTRYLGARPSKSCNKADGIRFFTKKAGIKTHWKMIAVTHTIQERANSFLKQKAPSQCTSIPSSSLLEPSYTNMMEILLQQYYTKVVTCPSSQNNELVLPTYFAQIVSACHNKEDNTVSMAVQMFNVRCPDSKGESDDGLLLTEEDRMYGVIEGAAAGESGEVVRQLGMNHQQGRNIQRASFLL